MWIIKDGEKKEYKPLEVYSTETEKGTYLVVIADEIRQGSVILKETRSKRKAINLVTMLTMGLGTDKTYRLD